MPVSESHPPDREQVLRISKIIIARLLTIASWLREKGKIPPDAARAPERWNKGLKQFWREETKSRHEHKPAAHATRPSSCFYLKAGSQVASAHRVDLDLEAGTFVVHGKDEKQGPKVKLNESQLEAVRKALGGYLRLLEPRRTTVR